MGRKKVAPEKKINQVWFYLNQEDERLMRDLVELIPGHAKELKQIADNLNRYGTIEGKEERQ